jgi:3-oxoacyl-[acyl-carrier-protein] synthase-3
MTTTYGFDRFIRLDADDAPDLLARMSKDDLGIDGERYGILSRLIARPKATVADLACAVTEKLMRECSDSRSDVGALVLSSRIADVEETASTVVDRLGVDCSAHGIERACSGFPAATEVGLRLCRQLQRPVLVVTAEIISCSINWEAPCDNPADHGRARGQASKLFGDGAAAVLIRPDTDGHVHQILDAWIDDVPDDKQLIQKAEIVDTVDPWGNVRPDATGCMSMPGRRGFYLVKRAPEIMADSVSRSYQQANAELELGEPIEHVVPHQANGLIISRLQTRLAGDGDRSPQVWDCIKNSGNTVSASIPLAMAEVQDRLPPGVLVAMPSVGAGGPGYRPDTLSTGCVLVRTGDVVNGR